jgi:hypothetical protein
MALAPASDQRPMRGLAFLVSGLLFIADAAVYNDGKLHSRKYSVGARLTVM